VHHAPLEPDVPLPRPGGAPGCRHWWSDAALGVAQAVEGGSAALRADPAERVKFTGPPRRGEGLAAHRRPVAPLSLLRPCRGGDARLTFPRVCLEDSLHPWRQPWAPPGRKPGPMGLFAGPTGLLRGPAGPRAGRHFTNTDCGDSRRWCRLIPRALPIGSDVRPLEPDGRADELDARPDGSDHRPDGLDRRQGELEASGDGARASAVQRRGSGVARRGQGRAAVGQGGSRSG